MKSLLGLLTVLLIGASGPIHAEKIYRWTDSSGQVHFSSQPPPEHRTQNKEVKLKVPMTQEEVEEEEAISAAKRAATANTPAQPRRMEAAEADAICNDALEQKANHAEIFVRRVKQPDGTFRPLNEEERNAYVRNLDLTILQYCTD